MEEAVPDVIVMDVIMPVMDGIEACRQITKLLPGTRVLMLTASNEQDAIVRSIAAGATGYLQKNTPERSNSLRPCGRSLWASSASQGTRPGGWPGRCEAHPPMLRPSAWQP